MFESTGGSVKNTLYYHWFTNILYVKFTKFI